MPPHLDGALLARVFRKDPAALREFVEAALAPIQREVASVCYFYMQGGARRHDVAAEVRDLTHDILLTLWTDEFKALRGWDPQGGRSLESYLRHYAKFRVLDKLRTKKQNPFQDDLKETDELDRLSGQHTAESEIAKKDLFLKLYERIKTLPAEDQEFLRLDRLEELSVQELMRRFKMPSENSVHKRRSRLLTKLQAWRDELESSLTDEKVKK